MFWLILIVAIVAVATAYKYRVKLLSKMLGQPEARVQRHLERRKQIDR